MKGLAILFCVLATTILSACGLLLEEESKIVAEVAGEPIRVGDLKEKIRGLPFEDRAKANDVAEDVRIEARLKVLKKIISRRLVLLEAKTLGEDVSEEEIHAALVRKHPGQERIENLSLDSKDVSSHEHKNEGEQYQEREIEEMREELIIEKLTAVATSDDVLRKLYEANKADYVLEPPIVIFEMVVVDLENRRVIDKIYETATQKGISLGDAVGELEEIPQVLFAGIAPAYSLDMLNPSIREAVENLRVREISKPFHFQEGDMNRYCVLRLLKLRNIKPFNLVKNGLLPKARISFMYGLHQKFGVEYFQENLNYNAER